ncbi:predicted protein [Scheffersomyces stipitis CBS 6054]|uniref:Pre-mRNA-splicing factor CWC26 n=1 Tax=Scheffersomyces stipitis (strain ATCC 58785 / CBS 6054 / NBRC 10063 / NRRL Y-11545) TaxID=322104 RepID=A3GI23_PICST|nr:predicted protein [Scheffersomyces stipitis CBS 6054]EAZ63158.2 predicted protein [Scheffersomyces stipitis CBS 6054]
MSRTGRVLRKSATKIMTRVAYLHLNGSLANLVSEHFCRRAAQAISIVDVVSSQICQFSSSSQSQMSSRADYLSKYLQSDKRKKKSKKIPSATSNVVIRADPRVEKVESEEEAEIIHDEESELAPVKVQIATKSQSKGFKRIDNGSEVVQAEREKVEEPGKIEPEAQQTTVYRDASGRIVDIDNRRKQFEQEKEAERDKRTFTELRTAEDEIERQQKEKYVPKQSQFEDPLLVFEDKQDEPENSTNAYSSYVYNKGVNPSNRFGIRAGYFWDGIDRSNGFEELVLRKQTEQKFQKMDTAINESYDLDYE